MKKPLNPYLQAASEQADQLAIDYLPAVRAMALRLKERLPASVEIGDLISAGAEELIKSARRFDENIIDNFWGYAKVRVRGAMLDYLRALDPLSRNTRTLIKRIDELIGSYVDEHDEEPSDEYLAQKLGISAAEVSSARVQAVLSCTLSLEDNTAEADSSAIAGLEASELAEQIADALAGLDERAQLIMQLYYYEELSFAEIAQILGITTARISQLHSAAIKKLKANLNG